jgi:Gamma-glutamyl phosphate reductase
VKTVSGLEEAIVHINRYSSHHTDAILAQDTAAIDRFANEIDSAIVMINSSTQFADGGEFGMGAEIGISTGRLHARGPVGCDQLVTYKYIVRSNGAMRP